MMQTTWPKADSSPAQLRCPFLIRRWHRSQCGPCLPAQLRLPALLPGSELSSFLHVSAKRAHSAGIGHELGAACTHSWYQPCPQPKDPAGLSTWAVSLLYGIASTALTNVQTMEMCSSTPPYLHSRHSPSLLIPQTSPTLLHFSVW